jgi:regulator of RNase E activity RraB
MTEKEFIKSLYSLLNILMDFYSPKILKEREIIGRLLENNVDPSNYFDLNRGIYIDYFENIKIIENEWGKQRDNLILNARKTAKEKGIVIIQQDITRSGLPEGVIDCWGNYTN